MSATPRLKALYLKDDLVHSFQVLGIFHRIRVVTEAPHDGGRRVRSLADQRPERPLERRLSIKSAHKSEHRIEEACLGQIPSNDYVHDERLGRGNDDATRPTCHSRRISLQFASCRKMFV